MNFLFRLLDQAKVARDLINDRSGYFIR